MGGQAPIYRFDFGSELSVWCFAHRYETADQARGAWERAESVLTVDDHAHLYRVIDPRDGSHLVVGVGLRYGDMEAYYQKVPWSGISIRPSVDLVRSLALRMAEVMVSASAQGQVTVNRVVRWDNLGGLKVTPRGTEGPMRKPQG